MTHRATLVRAQRTMADMTQPMRTKTNLRLEQAAVKLAAGVEFIHLR
jgi:hypothetical protein